MCARPTWGEFRVPLPLPLVADLATVAQHQGKVGKIRQPEGVQTARGIRVLAGSADDVGYVVPPAYGHQIGRRYVCPGGRHRAGLQVGYVELDRVARWR